MNLDDLLDLYINRIANRIWLAEDRHLTDAGERIRRLQAMTPEQLREYLHSQQPLADLNADVRRANRNLGRANAANERDIERLFDEVMTMTYSGGVALATRKGVTLPPLETFKARSGYMLMAALGRYRHMARSGAVDSRYKNKIGKMTRLIADGGADLPSVMRKTIRELAREGISTISYASGRSMRMDSAVRRDLVGEFTSIVQDVQKQIATEIGADGWEISAHQHSAKDHEDAQGNIFTHAEYEKLQNLETAVDIDGVPHHLEGRPIGDWNCRHIAYSFVIGVSQRAHSPDELAQLKKRNADGVMWNGQRISLYEAEQQQRKLETAMRREREMLNALKPLRDIDPKMRNEWRRSNNRLTSLRLEYRRLGATVRPHGLRMKPERSYVPRSSVGNFRL